MSGKEFTHKDLSRLLGVSETTVKSYRRKFPGCIPVAGYGKPIRFGEDALRVARRIRDLFEHGLGVDEVRARLAGEFAWIAAPPAETPERRPARGEGKEHPPERNAALAGLARSMVAVFQGQKEIIKRLDRLAALLQTTPAGAGPAVPAGPGQSPDGFGHVRESSGQADAEPSGQAPEGSGQADTGPSGQAPGLSGRTDDEPAGQVCRVIPLRRQDTPGTRGPTPDAPRMPKSPAAEPPRRFLALPLVAAAGHGGYVGAGGRKRGRFSLNDLKAMLVFSFAPPRHFRFVWEEQDDAWILNLEQEQEQGGRRIRILLAERPSRVGTAAEILRLEDNGEDLHPAEICAIIDSLGT
ncbi:MAG: helix-turn-helix domain-containing protein [Desulfovibrio sp.]|jgi:hypothetical protein|nr:helix-turn-helix domain-containing protein [Desulfovibrio sp.]